MALVELKPNIVGAKHFPLLVALVWAVLCFLLIFLGFVQVGDIHRFQFTPYARPLWGLVIAGFSLLIIAGAAWAIVLPRSTVQVQEAGSRDDYLEEVIKNVKASETSIAMCMRTLEPSRRKQQILALQSALSEKTNGSHKSVRLIAPTGEERAEASLELNRKGIHLRHLPTFDISFGAFDSRNSVFPYRTDEKGKTLASHTIISSVLAETLEDLIDRWWWRYDALPPADFLRFTVAEILSRSDSRSANAIARDLSVDLVELRELLPAFDSHHEQRKVFFVIGRPCSGKTTVAGAIQDALVKAGIGRQEIYVYNDYEALHERFRADIGRNRFTTFARGDHGGFAVQDFSVLDTVLKQANFRLRAALPFFRAFILEFARDSYAQALRNFDNAVVGASTVVYVHCKLDTCRARNTTRTVLSADYRTGYIPEAILTGFYRQEDVKGAKGMSGRFIEIDTDTTDLTDLPFVVSEQVVKRALELK